jgi:ABC-type sugar transport system permease subunit
MQRKRTLAQQDALIGFALILPSFLIILGISLQPILTTLYLSLFEVPRGINLQNTVLGLGNYISLLSEPIFWSTIGRTLYFTAISVGIELVLGLAIAQLIHAHPPGWQFLRTSLIIPWAVPTIVNGTMWRWIWHSVPFIALILQAALATLPPDLEEAASVDGATAFQYFWFIRLPLLRPAMLVALIIRTVEAFRAFDIIYVITNGGPANGTVTISFLTYLEMFSFGHAGRGSALSFLISLFTLTLAFIYIRMLYRPEEKL